MNMMIKRGRDTDLNPDAKRSKFVKVSKENLARLEQVVTRACNAIMVHPGGSLPSMPADMLAELQQAVQTLTDVIMDDAKDDRDGGVNPKTIVRRLAKENLQELNKLLEQRGSAKSIDDLKEAACEHYKKLVAAGDFECAGTIYWRSFMTNADPESKGTELGEPTDSFQQFARELLAHKNCALVDTSGSGKTKIAHQLAACDGEDKLYIYVDFKAFAVVLTDMLRQLHELAVEPNDDSAIDGIPESTEALQQHLVSLRVIHLFLRAFAEVAFELEDAMHADRQRSRHVMTAMYEFLSKPEYQHLVMAKFYKAVADLEVMSDSEREYLFPTNNPRGMKPVFVLDNLMKVAATFPGLFLHFHRLRASECNLDDALLRRLDELKLTSDTVKARVHFFMEEAQHSADSLLDQANIATVLYGIRQVLDEAAGGSQHLLLGTHFSLSAVLPASEHSVISEGLAMSTARVPAMPVGPLRTALNMLVNISGYFKDIDFDTLLASFTGRAAWFFKFGLRALKAHAAVKAKEAGQDADVGGWLKKAASKDDVMTALKAGYALSLQSVYATVCPDPQQRVTAYVRNFLLDLLYAAVKRAGVLQTTARGLELLVQKGCIKFPNQTEWSADPATTVLLSDEPIVFHACLLAAVDYGQQMIGHFRPVTADNRSAKGFTVEELGALLYLTEVRSPMTVADYITNSKFYECCTAFPRKAFEHVFMYPAVSGRSEDFAKVDGKRFSFEMEALFSAQDVRVDRRVFPKSANGTDILQFAAESGRSIPLHLDASISHHRPSSFQDTTPSLPDTAMLHPLPANQPAQATPTEEELSPAPIPAVPVQLSREQERAQAQLSAERDLVATILGKDGVATSDEVGLLHEFVLLTSHDDDTLLALYHDAAVVRRVCEQISYYHSRGESVGHLSLLVGKRGPLKALPGEDPALAFERLFSCETCAKPIVHHYISVPRNAWEKYMIC
eukprot:TRINITY_DN2149_c0_g1_i1.p1 TRINITY_DN2149_c0_g1~~TRINITY_DN2149_c0_g1_i1.p1  ORF type:complete len:960 (-),score=177.28 TRINITY_DN2149_c0_g1_i1:2209-5088(-)